MRRLLAGESQTALMLWERADAALIAMWWSSVCALGFILAVAAYFRFVLFIGEAVAYGLGYALDTLLEDFRL